MRLRSHGQEPRDDFAETPCPRQSERQRPRRGTPDRMSYGVEWMGGAVVSGIVLLLLIVPEFAAIAVVVGAIGVLVALAALVGLVALAAAALASPYLLVRSLRRRLAPTKKIDPPAERDLRAGRPPDPLRVLGRAHATAFARDEPAAAGAILEDATR